MRNMQQKATGGQRQVSEIAVIHQLDLPGRPLNAQLRVREGLAGI